MRQRFYAALLLLAASLAPVLPLHAATPPAAPDALAAIDACTARLDAPLDVGYERIAARCPDLAPALEQSGWAAWLPRGWKESRNDLSAGSLLELRAVVVRELATRPAGHAPRVERLKEVLADLGDAGQQRSGLWARINQWLRQLLERSNERSDEGWLNRIISRIGVSGAVRDVITFTALALVVALAGLIVSNEVRASGILRGLRSGDDADDAADALASRPKLTWSEIERAPLLERPRLLLELIATRLTDQKRLPPAGAFTVREITRGADLREPADRERLADLALTAERARYAESGVEPAAVENAVAGGRELLTHLDPDESEARAAGARG